MRPIDCNIHRRPPGMPGGRWRFLIRYPDGSEREVFSDSPRIILGPGQTMLERERTFPDRRNYTTGDAVRQREALQKLLAVALKQIEHDYRATVEYAVAMTVQRWRNDPTRLQLRTYSSNPNITDVFDTKTRRNL